MSLKPKCYGDFNKEMRDARMCGFCAVALGCLKTGESVTLDAKSVARNLDAANKEDTGKRKISLIHPVMLDLLLPDYRDTIKSALRQAIMDLAYAAHAKTGADLSIKISDAVGNILISMSGNRIEAISEAAKAMEYGEAKPEYGRNNWKKGMEWSRLIDAAQRHLLAILDEEMIDKDSGNTHVAHAFGSIHMLLGNIALGVGTNDIY